jgi:hypothetical protein
MSEKKLKPTQELIDLMDEYQSCIQCRDRCIKMVFFTNPAIKYGKKAIKAERKFWRLSEELHPEIKDDAWIYNIKEQTYRKKNENES